VRRLIARPNAAGSLLFRVALAFALRLRLRPPAFAPRRAVRVVGARAVRATADLEIAAEPADGETALAALAYLSSAMPASKVWHRACLDGVRRALARFGGRCDVREFLKSL
jgi:hypothetical protein